MQAVPESTKEHLRGLLIRTLAKHHVSGPDIVADAILQGLLSAPEEIRIDLIHRLMGGSQCLLCGDMLD